VESKTWEQGYRRSQGVSAGVAETGGEGDNGSSGGSSEVSSEPAKASRQIRARASATVEAAVYCSSLM